MKQSTNESAPERLVNDTLANTILILPQRKQEIYTADMDSQPMA